MSDTRVTVDRLTAAMNGHDAQRATDGYAPGAVLVTPEGTFEGREAARAYFQQFLDAFPDLAITTWNKVTSGAVTVDEWEFSGTHTGPMPLAEGDPVPATGRRVSMRGCDVATVEHGQVISHRLYYDQMDLLGQLGLNDTDRAGR